MDKCFAYCGCDDLEGVTKSDLDRYTDKIENILNDENGRRLFRGFMFTSKFKDGRRSLDFWEHCDKLINHKELNGDHQASTHHTFQDEAIKLIEEAEKIDEFDLATMERLETLSNNSATKDEIVAILKILKSEAAKSMRREYNAFRRHFAQI